MDITVIQMDLWKDHIDDQWLSFNEARAIVHSWDLEYEEDWITLISNTSGIQHPGIPQNPEFIYRHTGWKGWQDWLVHPDRRLAYNPFHEAREFTWCLRLTDEQAWDRYIQNGDPVHKSYGLNIPARPFIEYRGKGWVDWIDWLGINTDFRNHEETRKFIRTLHLKSRGEWDLYCKGRLTRSIKKPKVIYRYPEVAYKGDGWISWEDWLGID
jgi:hypothetical protein